MLSAADRRSSDEVRTSVRRTKLQHAVAARAGRAKQAKLNSIFGLRSKHHESHPTTVSLLSLPSSAAMLMTVTTTFAP